MADKKLDLEKIKFFKNELKKALKCVDELVFSIPDASSEIALLLKNAWQRFICLQEALKGNNICDDCLKEKIEAIEISDQELQPQAQRQIDAFNAFSQDLFSETKITAEVINNNQYILQKESDLLIKEANKVLHTEFWTKRNKNLAIIFASIFLLAIAGLIASKLVETQTWNVTYFSNPSLSGRAGFVNQESDVTLKSRAKLKKMTGANVPFSVRYETCLNVLQGEEFNFELGSDDGSRLKIDNNLIIDNWGAHSFITRYGKMFISEGKHKVVIEYNDLGGGSKILFKPTPNSKFNDNIYLPDLNGNCF